MTSDYRSPKALLNAIPRCLRLPLISKYSAVFAVLALGGGAVCSAPLDALLTAVPEQVYGKSYLELSSGHMNGRLDFFGIRQQDPSTADTMAGDYRDARLMGGVLLADKTWLSGGLWRRAVSDSSDTYFYTSWQIAGQYRLHDEDERFPAFGLHVSAWGNQAAATQTNSPVVVPGAKLNTVRIEKPADKQLQADLIASWTLSPATRLSGFVGLGSTALSYAGLSATTTRNGCNYQLSFRGNDIYGVLAEPCTATGGVIQQFYDRSGSYGIDVANEIAWHGYFIQTGLNSTWQYGPWTLRAGYQLYSVRRKQVDAILSARGKATFSLNQNIITDASYSFNSHWNTFFRAQLSSNLFLDELPVTYNTATSARFGKKYSVFTLGMRLHF